MMALILPKNLLIRQKRWLCVRKFDYCLDQRLFYTNKPKRDLDEGGVENLSGTGASPKYDAYLYKEESWFNVPNSITISRILTSPGLTYAIVHDMKGLALTGCMLAGFTDWLDGYLARKLNQSTVLGSMIDPVADKVVIGSLTLGLAIKGLIPVELASLIIGRDVFLFGASMVFRAIERPPDAPFFDTTYSATFEIVPSTLSKFNTVNQFLLMTITLGHFALDIPASIEIIKPLWYLTGFTTIGSLVGYLDGSAIKRLSKAGVSRGQRPVDTSSRKDLEK